MLPKADGSPFLGAVGPGEGGALGCPFGGDFRETRRDGWEEETGSLRGD